MKTRNWIIVLVVVGLVALGGGYMLGLFNQDDLETVEKISDVTEEADELFEDNEDELDSEIIVKDEAKKDALEEEEFYVDEQGSISSDSPELSIEEGLVAYYPFNEDIKDYSGKEIDATNHNAFFVDGKYGKALKFNGKNSYVHALVNINPSQMPQITMAAWVKETNGADIMQVISSDNSGYDRAIGADIRGAGDGWACFAGDGKVLGFHPLQTSKWTFIAAVYDQEAGTVKLFVDGSTIEKKAKSVGNSNDFITIGAREASGRLSEFFNGIIDEVKIYDYALSDTELNSLYKTGIARPISE